MKAPLPFWLATAIESSLIVVALAVAMACAVPLESLGRWSWGEVAWGMAGALPMLIGFWWLMRWRHPSMSRIRKFIEQVLRPAMAGWTVAQLLAISLLAGLAEELLFRGVLQGGMTRWWGAIPAWLVASALFGMCHWITPAYAVMAGLMGCYLGGLWWWRESVVAPAVSHAVYDAVALIWLIKIRKPGAPGSEG
jgi:membrane protease YdiL (CAAX protease family)